MSKEQLNKYRADFHVHTVLSPCAEVEMIPPLIVQEALARNIHLIAITDHNSTANIAAVQQAASGTPLTVLPGMEVQTREEVHVLCLFDTLQQAEKWQKIVTESLPRISNRPDFFGEQYVVDKTGEFIRHEQQMLITSTDLTFQQAWQKVNTLGGLFIPAHVNRKGFGLFHLLGFIPPDTPVDAIEISRHISIREALDLYPQIQNYPLMQNGDVHRLEELLGVNELAILEPSINEIRTALKREGGRSLQIIEQ